MGSNPILSATSACRFRLRIRPCVGRGGSCAFRGGLLFAAKRRFAARIRESERPAAAGSALPPCRDGRLHLPRRPPFRRGAALRGESTGDPAAAAAAPEIQLCARFCSCAFYRYIFAAGDLPGRYGKASVLPCRLMLGPGEMGRSAPSARASSRVDGPPRRVPQSSSLPLQDYRIFPECRGEATVPSGGSNSFRRAHRAADAAQDTGALQALHDEHRGEVLRPGRLPLYRTARAPGGGEAPGGGHRQRAIFFTSAGRLSEHGGRIGKGEQGELRAGHPPHHHAQELFASGVRRPRQEPHKSSPLQGLHEGAFAGPDEFEIALGYGYDRDEAVAFRNRVAGLLDSLGLHKDDIPIRHISSVISVHTGPYPLGICVLKKARLD